MCDGDVPEEVVTSSVAVDDVVISCQDMLVAGAGRSTAAAADDHIGLADDEAAAILWRNSWLLDLVMVE